VKFGVERNSDSGQLKILSDSDGRGEVGSSRV
jgi:hypothetical protein